MRPHSPFRLPGLDVDRGARRPQFLGEDVHPHLYLALEQRRVSWQEFLASALGAGLGALFPALRGGVQGLRERLQTGSQATAHQLPPFP